MNRLLFYVAVLIFANGCCEANEESCSASDGNECGAKHKSHMSSNHTEDLLVSTVATSATDGFQRFMRSANVNKLNVEVIGMGQEWTGGDIAHYAGGGMKVNLLKEALTKHKDNDDLIIMFVDSYDLILTADSESILNSFKRFGARVVFSAEGFCWPDHLLADKYPAVGVNEKRYLNSGGFIGYASELYSIVTHKDIADGDDDQLYYTKIYLDTQLREKFNIKLDTKSEIFQNLNGALDDVKLMFRGSTSYLLNHRSGSQPLVIHGNGPIKVSFNRLANYLANSWTPDTGCIACKENTVSLAEVQDEDLPLVYIAIFVHYPTAFITDFFRRVTELDYPKSRIDVFIHYTDEYHNDDIKKFTDAVTPLYKSVKVIGPSVGLNQWQGRNMAIEECITSKSQYYLALDGDAQIEVPTVLKTLIQYNRTVIGPMISRPGSMWSNFWGALSNDGFYRRSDDYLEILNREKLGQWNVPYLANLYLIHGSVLSQLTGGYINGDLDPDMALSKTLREKDIFLYVDNREYIGHLVNSETYNTERLHGDLYEIFDNEYTWKLKYIHPDYYQQMETDFENLQPCPDVYWIPFITETFADHLVEEMEYYGQWSEGKPEDARLQGGYENVPTVDIHTNQIGWERHWLQILKLYIAPFSGKVYTGYHSEARAIMNFVVRYKPGEQDRLRPHHDSSTYSVIIALNEPHKEYEGGGTNFLRYNCKHTDSRKGWMLMFPGRLTHYHEGLPTTQGTRYIMVSFIDP